MGKSIGWGHRLGIGVVFTVLFSILMAGGASAVVLYGYNDSVYAMNGNHTNNTYFLVHFPDRIPCENGSDSSADCYTSDYGDGPAYDIWYNKSGVDNLSLQSGEGAKIMDFGAVGLLEYDFQILTGGSNITPLVDHTYGLDAEPGTNAKIFIRDIDANAGILYFDWVWQNSTDSGGPGPYFGVNPGCNVTDEHDCDLLSTCTWDAGKNFCEPKCPSTFSDPDTAEYECEGYFIDSMCKYDALNSSCKFQPFDFGSYGCGISGVSDNKTSCNLISNCTWDDLAPDGGKCLINCWGMKNQTACSSTDSIFYLSGQNESLCVWKPNPLDDTQGVCDPFFFDKCFEGFSPCFEFDGDEQSCNAMSDECMWFSEPYCSESWCTDKNSTDGDLDDHGWCDPKFSFADMFTLLSGPEAECWRLDGNKSGCNAMKEEYQQPCVWFPDPWAPDFTGEEGGWCNMEFGAFFGGVDGCWGIIDETNCNDATAIGCNWTNDTFNPNGGFCKEQGCWDFDNYNESCAEFSNNMSFFNCTWEDTSGDNSTGWCNEDWKEFKCSSNNNKSKACFDTFYCVWKDDTNECLDPMSIGGGMGFPGPMGPNPGCFILPTEQKCLELNNTAGDKYCEWSGGNCIDNSSHPLDPTTGINCSVINNSNFCNNIPFLPSCCEWNNVNGTCDEAPYSTACWDNLKANVPPPGKEFCEDWNVTTSTDCDLIAGDPWYMPCKWDAGECRFAFDDMFGGGPLFDKGFDDIFSEGSCEDINGVWQQEKWSDPNYPDQVFIDEWCEVGFGKEFESCNTSCWACEYRDNGSNWENGTAMKDACEAAYGPGGEGCRFFNDTNAFNGIGWCDVNFTFVFDDFEFEDCFTPWDDSDGDGFLPDKDPDCTEFFKWGGFIKPEIGHECADGIDNNGDNQTDCDDPSCKYDPVFCSGNVSLDTDQPEIKLLTLDRYTDGAFFDIVTNEPTNATILFYYNDSACNPGNQSNVTDPKLNNTEGANWTQFDDYDIWHGIPVDNIYLAQLSLPATLQNGTAYYYKAQVFDKAGNNATGNCKNFTTLNATANFTVGFKLPPPEDDNTTMFGYLRVQFDWDGDGIFEENQSLDNEKKKVNKSKAKKVNIRFFNPFATDAWEIQILGAKFKDKDGSRVLNITDAFVVNNTGTDIIVGMKKSVWSELAQKLGADYLRIIIPKGSSGLTDVSVNHCPDNATAANQDDCNSVYSASDTTKADCTISATQTICDIPVNIGFSVFGVAGTVASGDTTSSGGGGGAEAKNVTVNATVQDGNVTAIFAKISSGTIGTMTIPDDVDVGFKELAIKVKATVTNAEIVIYKLDEKPSSISEDITGEIQTYIQLDETNIEAADIDTVTIKFKVPVSWINDKKIDTSKVVLNRYADGKWNALTATKESEDSAYVHYSAASPGLSVFGISGQVIPPKETPPITTTMAPTTTPPPTTKPPVTPAVEPADGGGVPPGIIAILAIVIIAGVAYYFYQKKSEEEGEAEAPEEEQEAAEEPAEEEQSEEEPVED